MNLKTTWIVSALLTSALFGLIACGGSDGDFEPMAIPQETKITKVFEGMVPKMLIDEGANTFYTKGCTRCHATKGDKRLVGPSLFRVRDRMGVAEMEAWIRYPEKLKEKPLMPGWEGSDAELIAVIAYLRSLHDEEVPQKEEPKKPFKPMAVKKDTPVVRALEAGVPKQFADEGATYFELKKCNMCHKRKGKIKTVGPILAGIKDRMSVPELETWIRYPGRLKEKTLMPPWDGTDDQLIRLIAYLKTL